MNLCLASTLNVTMCTCVVLVCGCVGWQNSSVAWLIGSDHCQGWKKQFLCFAAGSTCTREMYDINQAVKASSSYK